MHHRSRRVLPLACFVLYYLSWSGWGGPWLGVLAFVLGVGAVVLELSERRRRKVDELTTLNIPQ